MNEQNIIMENTEEVIKVIEDNTDKVDILGLITKGAVGAAAVTAIAGGCYWLYKRHTKKKAEKGNLRVEFEVYGSQDHAVDLDENEDLNK